jgi:hypothetical protein
MKFYRTSHLEDYPPKQINSSRRPAALKRPTTTGYSNNERSKTFVIDVSDVGTHVVRRMVWGSLLVSYFHLLSPSSLLL